MMEWSDVAETVGAIAPAAGGLLAGQAGAAAGRLVARALGVAARPETVAEAVQADPEAALKLREIEADLERKVIDADTERQGMVNETMRQELQADSWFKSGWRPALGWTFAASLGALAVTLAATILRDPTVVGDPEFSGLLVWLIATMGAALGINVRERTKGKALAQGKTPASFLDRLKTK